MLVVLSSCGSQEKEIQTLSGKVYSSGDGADSETCRSIPAGTDFFMTFLFVNDSQFIDIINTCCPGIDEGFPSETYLRGTYKLDDSHLTLNYEPRTVVLYVKEASEGSENESSERLAVEAASSHSVKLERFECKTAPYFLFKDEEYTDYFALSDSSVTFENYKKDLEERGIWKLLFNNSILHK
jgi:hypothetical protein